MGGPGPGARRCRCHRPSPSRPCCYPPTDPETDRRGRPIDPDDEPVARISLRLPQSVKVRVDELAAADGISTNAWLIRAVMDALATPSRPPASGRGPRRPRCRRARAGSSGRTVRSARTASSARTVPSGRSARSATEAAARVPASGRARPRPGPGLGAMSFRNSTHEGVRRVVVDNLGERLGHRRARRTDRRWSSARSTPAEEEFLDAVQVRQERDALRISFPPELFRNTNAHLRLGVPAGPGVRDQGRVGRRLGERRHRPVADQSAARATSASAGRATWSAPPARVTSRWPSSAVRRRGWRPGPGTSRVGEADCPVTRQVRVRRGDRQAVRQPASRPAPARATSRSPRPAARWTCAPRPAR